MAPPAFTETTLEAHNGPIRRVGTLRMPSVDAAAQGVGLDGDAVPRPLDDGSAAAPPRRRLPAALLVGGSGKVDRDENAFGLRVDAIRQVAAHLAHAGVASLRYDKRGVGKSSGDYNETGFHDNVADAEAALAALRAHPAVDPAHVVVVGHSEGALIAVRVAARGAPVAGVVLLAAPARSGEAVLVWQAEQLAKSLTPFEKRLLRVLHVDVLRAQRKVIDRVKQTDRSWLRVRLFHKLNAKWLREFMAYDPAAADLPALRVPVLAVTGAKDIQVDPADLKVMKSLVQSDFEAHELPDVTHLLRTDPGEPSMSTYRAQLRRPVDDGLLRLVSEWVIGLIVVPEAGSTGEGTAAGAGEGAGTGAAAGAGEGAGTGTAAGPGAEGGVNDRSPSAGP